MDKKLESLNIKKYFAYTVVYVALFVGLLVFNQLFAAPLDSNNIGGYFVALVLPLAVFWLVVGCLHQVRELSLNAESLKAQAEELKNSVAEIKASNATAIEQEKLRKSDEKNARTATFLKFQELILRKLNSNTAMLVKLMCGGSGKYKDVVSGFEDGDVYAYFHFIKKVLGEESTTLKDWSKKGKILPSIIDSAKEYCSAYEFLMDEAKKVDEGNGTFEPFFEKSVMADVYKLLKNDPDMQNTGYSREISTIESIAA